MIKHLKIKTLKEITLYNSLKNNFSKLSDLNYCDKEINHKNISASNITAVYGE